MQARTINKIQKSLIQELNKIALIHLYLLGMEDELNNFELSLTNPSAQSDLLRIEQWKEKITLYKDATSDQSQVGILPVSHTWAKKNILGFSDSDVLLDLQQQRLERAVGQELTNSAQIIRRSGIFDDVDAKYGIPEEEREKIEAQQAANPPAGGEMGGLGGGLSGPPPGLFSNVVVSTDEKDLESLDKKILETKLDTGCSICMGNLDVGEQVSELKCSHVFHTDCIKPYLEQYNYKCPVCRAEVGKAKYNL